jgi:hypothetical protein
VLIAYVTSADFVKGTTLEWVEILKKPNLEKLEADLKVKPTSSHSHIFQLS